MSKFRRYPGRRSRRSRGGRRSTRKYSTGVYAKITAQISDFDIPAAGYFNEVLNFDVNDLAAGGGPQAAEFASYAALFDQVKVLKMKYTFWLSDNDEITKADTTMPQFLSVYDPDANNRVYSATSIERHPKHRHTIMKPGVKYSLSFSPRWKLTNGTANAPALYSYNNYMDIDDFTAANTGDCVNGIQIQYAMAPEANAIRYYYTYYLHFRNRRQGTQYV